jgi:hypothetical protein
MKNKPQLAHIQAQLLNSPVSQEAAGGPGTTSKGDLATSFLISFHTTTEPMYTINP